MLRDCHHGDAGDAVADRVDDAPADDRPVRNRDVDVGDAADGHRHHARLISVEGAGGKGEICLEEGGRQTSVEVVVAGRDVGECKRAVGVCLHCGVRVVHLWRIDGPEGDRNADGLSALRDAPGDGAGSPEVEVDVGQGSSVGADGQRGGCGSGASCGVVARVGHRAFAELKAVVAVGHRTQSVCAVGEHGRLESRTGQDVGCGHRDVACVAIDGGGPLPHRPGDGAGGEFDVHTGGELVGGDADHAGVESVACRCGVGPFDGCAALVGRSVEAHEVVTGKEPFDGERAVGPHVGAREPEDRVADPGVECDDAMVEEACRWRLAVEDGPADASVRRCDVHVGACAAVDDLHDGCVGRVADAGRVSGPRSETRAECDPVSTI